jgi:hypothetical protein
MQSLDQSESQVWGFLKYQLVGVVVVVVEITYRARILGKLPSCFYYVRVRDLLISKY